MQGRGTGAAACDRAARARARFVDALCAQASASPERLALVGDDEVLSYGEFWQRTSTAAARLGDQPGVVRVPALHEPATVVAMVAAWLAGGTYCPVDPAYPVGHVDAMLASVDGLVGPEIAYVLFTSGSSGRPKPVAVPHRALAAVVPALVELFDITESDRVLQVASLSWDTSFEEILPALTAGACVTFGRDAHSGSLHRMLRLVHSRDITVLDLPTALWHELVVHLHADGTGLPDCVRLVVIGGEAVNPARLEEWRALPGADRIRLLNTYGATETALITHAAGLHGPASLPGHASDLSGPPPEWTTIGWRLGHVRQHITEGGELLVGGPSLAVGYPGLPEETAERFVEIDDDRFFRTGDLVREGADGELHHLGRLDAQVKVRGIRVDPGEVEAALVTHPDIVAAAVVATTISGRTALAAYVVSAPGPGTALPADLRKFLRDRVPAHLHPARITAVPALAQTASGKVDRRATHDRFGTPRHGPTVRPPAEEAIR